MLTRKPKSQVAAHHAPSVHSTPRPRGDGSDTTDSAHLGRQGPAGSPGSTGHCCPLGARRPLTPAAGGLSEASLTH